MIDATPDYLLSVLDTSTAKKVWKHLRGVRIYFPKCRSVHDEIKNLYSSMNCENSTAIKRLAELFEMSESQIRRIVRKQGVLFEEY